ncbi:hypothetical protein BUALT_Bualt07G0053800 [Buddleja alternifolia]|uniref:Uncharacterized protein n=1 Tax=Buddleja alternifolia TaxID=168488 RepID=A0AAV6WLM1_9LAMI|nr:hypothetical protein BUALT_Bualt15G0094200 [Buddleja alternifolia]KAG8379108.1 hypothetical protein BUALT_Bualt07G0053800 [Buddleja alternifolia]
MNLNEKNKLRRLKLAQKNPEQRREELLYRRAVYAKKNSQERQEELSRRRSSYAKKKIGVLRDENDFAPSHDPSGNAGQSSPDGVPHDITMNQLRLKELNNKDGSSSHSGQLNINVLATSSDYQGISLGSTSTSGVFIDPPIPDTLKLNAWKSKNAITLRSISKSKDYMANANTVVATDSLQMMDINGAIDAPKGTNQFLNDVDDSLKDQPHVFVIRKKLMTRNGTDHDQYVILDVLLENDDTLDEGIADLAHESASKGKVTVSSMQLIDEDDWATDVRVHIEEPSKLSKVNPTHVSSTKTKGKSLARLRENSISQSIENDSVHLIDEAPVEIPRKSSKVNYTRKLSKVNSASVSSSKTKGKSIACRRENSAYQSIDDDSFTLIGGAAPTEIPLKTYKVNSARKLSKVNSAPVSSSKAKDDISGSVEIVTKSCKTKFVDDDAEDYPRRSSRKVKRRLFYGDESGEDDQPIINCIKRKRD